MQQQLTAPGADGSAASAASAATAVTGYSRARFAILGSGASTGSPWLQCLISESNCCAVCAEARDNPSSKNNRGNVSALVSVWPAPSPSQPSPPRPHHVMIDAGKTMRTTVSRCFPALGVHALDAVLLSHAHADAYLGLDDLRDIAPRAPLPVYLTAQTFRVVATAFPYLADAGAPSKTFVARLDWRIITPWEPFSIPEAGGLLVTPVPVAHGPGEEDVCIAFEFGERDAGKVEEVAGAAADSAPPVSAAPSSSLPSPLPSPPPSRVLWVSDVSALSCEARAYFRSRPTSLLLLDCLNYRRYHTHFSMLQAVNCAVDMRAGVTRFVGMNHRLDHDLETAALADFGRTLAPDPLDLGLAYDGEAFEVDIGRVITVEGLRREVEAVRTAAREEAERAREGGVLASAEAGSAGASTAGGEAAAAAASSSSSSASRSPLSTVPAVNDPPVVAATSPRRHGPESPPPRTATARSGGEAPVEGIDVFSYDQPVWGGRFDDSQSPTVRALLQNWSFPPR
jgi:phosphoribosyl 1,2-cyclic phosphodiesterase